MVALVEVTDLVKHFGSIPAVQGVSFEIDRGEVLGFLGPNGAGKSTTMKMISGFLTPDRGCVRIEGSDCIAHPVRSKQRMGYLPEGAPLYGDMTPRQLLRFCGEIRGYGGDRLIEMMDKSMKRVNLGSVADQPIETLSKGYKRRTGIAQAILHDPDVLILDEPTDGLDPNQKHEVRRLIRDMAKTKAIILSTHILEEVDAVCTRAIIVSAGKIVADGKPSTLQSQSPRHNAVVLRVRNNTMSAIESVLRGLEGVRLIEAEQLENGLIELVVFPEHGFNLSKIIGSAVSEHHWQVEEMRLEKGHLDEFFRSVTNTHRT